MTRRRALRRVSGAGALGVLTLVCALGALAGCGGDAKPQTTSFSDAARTPRTTPASSSATGHGPRAALIGLDDLSPGWSREGTIDTGLQCGSFDPFRAATKVVDSGSFHHGYAFIQETVGVFADEQASSRAYRALTSGDAERCVRRTMHRRMQFESGASTAFVTPVQVGRVDRLGPQSRAVRYRMTFRGEVGSGDAYIVTVSARTGNGVASLMAISSFEPLAEAAYTKLGELVDGYLGSALG